MITRYRPPDYRQLMKNKGLALTILGTSLGVLILLPSLALFPPASSPRQEHVRPSAVSPPPGNVTLSEAEGQFATVRLSAHGEASAGELPPASGGAGGVAERLPPASAPESPASYTPDWWTAVQEDLHRREYHVAWQESPLSLGGAAGYQAPNRAQNLRIGFYPTGIHVVERRETGFFPKNLVSVNKPWTWGLALTGFGHEGAVASVDAPSLSIRENHVTYQRGPLTEWYTNDESGLEQGLEISNLQSPTSNLQPPIALELALSGDLSPHLTDEDHAIEFTTPDGTPVLRYGLTHATDAGGRPLPAQITLAPSSTVPDASRNTHHALRITLDDSTATYPINVRLTITALPSSADWIGESNQNDARLGHALSTAGDVNGDGYSDLVVGAPWYDGGKAGEGAVFVYYGGPTGLVTTTVWPVHPTDQENAHFGTAVSIAGDVNGDGYADVIASAPDYDDAQPVLSEAEGSDKGLVFVYHGSPTGLTTGTADWTTAGSQEDAHFGAAVSTAGDVNGDGYADVIIGAPDHNGDQTDEGAAFVYHGGPTGLVTTTVWSVHPTDQENGHFGAAVSIAGDVNGDGYADVIIGAPGYDITGTASLTDSGCVYVYQGSSTGLTTGTADWTTTGNQEDAYFGTTVSTAGDVNGDGYADIIVGAPDHNGDQTDEGAAFVYHGGPTGLVTTTVWTVHPTNQENSHFGAAASIAGDVNSDGYADVVIGAPDYDDVQTDEGAAFVYQGGPDGLAATPAWSAHPTDQENGHFGTTVSTAGDVNGDGHGDLAIGATGYDHEHTDEGAAFVYHGSPGGLDAASTWHTTGRQAGALLGWSVSSAGDVDGDGYADVIVGAPRYDHGQAEEGVAFLYTSGPDGPATSPAWMGESDQAWAWFGYAVATVGDVDNDGYGDIIVGAPRYDITGTIPLTDTGQAFVYHGGPTGPVTTTTWTAHPTNQAHARFGTAVSTAGDVNGDGYADAIITANGYDDAQTNEGAAFVYYGGTTGLAADPAWAAHPTGQAYANFGRSASTAGDVNGDGYSDVVVGAPWYEYPQTENTLDGTTFVYHGSATGLSPDPDWTVTNVFTDAQLGIAVSTAGDVNADGYGDVVIGAYKYTEVTWVTPWQEGAALVYHGSSAGLTTGPADWMTTGGKESAKFGLSVSTAGDVNGDGYGDVVIGAPNYADGEPQEGIASIYYGGPNGLSTSPAWSTQGNQQGAGYGFSVSTAGDVNGDGYSDIIVGAPTYNSAQVDTGGAFVYLGNGGGGLPVCPRQLRSDGSGPIAPLGLSDSSSQVHLQVTGRSPLGRGLVKLQWQLAPLGTPFTAATAISGTSPAWSDVLTTGVALSQTVDGLAGNTVYRWRARLIYRPGDRLGQTAGRWLYMGWNGPQEADFRTPSVLAPDRGAHFFLPLILRGLPSP